MLTDRGGSRTNQQVHPGKRAAGAPGQAPGSLLRGGESGYDHRHVVGGAPLEGQVDEALTRLLGAAALAQDADDVAVGDDEIARIVGEGDDAEGACRRLVDLTLERGATDNVTVVVARFAPR